MNDDGIVPSLKFMLTKNFELEILLNSQNYLDIFYPQSSCESIRLSFFHFFVPNLKFFELFLDFISLFIQLTVTNETEGLLLESPSKFTVRYIVSSYI